MIALDVMGGDFAPHAILQGALKAARSSIPIKLFGPEKLIRTCLTELDQTWESYSITIEDASEVIEMDEEPVNAVRKKTRSSLVKAVESVRLGDCSAVISAGNSGALMVAATFILGRTQGIERPAIAGFMPAEKGSVLTLDLGANTECRAQHLFQFAQLGVSYIEEMTKHAAPRIGLLANGHEDRKGSALTKEVFALLKAEKSFNFVGNVEPFDLFTNKADLVVTDGFSGNILLKTMEASYELFMRIVQQETLHVDVQVKHLLNETLHKRIDSRYQGGALLLGVQGRVIVCHGNADAIAIAQALALAFSPCQRSGVKIMNDFQLFHRNNDA